MLRYTVPDFGVDVTVPVDDTFKSNLNLTNSAPVYFGFTGANGGYAQEKAVAFVDVEGLVELDMRTGVFEKTQSNYCWILVRHLPSQPLSTIAKPLLMRPISPIKAPVI